jgi:hypothetical protein
MYFSQILALYLGASGDYEEAATEYERSSALEGDRGLHEGLRLARLLDQAASVGEIDAQFRRIAELDPTNFANRMRAVWKSRDEARSELDRIFASAQATGASSQTYVAIAQWAGWYEDIDLALAALHEAHVESRRMFLGTLWGPALRTVRADPRFKSLARELKLADYWQATGRWGDYCRPLGDDDFECR